MAPKYDKGTQRWTPSSEAESATAGYDTFGTFLRQGPGPTFYRVFKADEYDQGVLKFMAGDKIQDRNVAQAEMDAYLRNPNDWAYNRLNNYNVDYYTLNTKQIVLTLTWASFILTLISRAAYCLNTGDYFWDILHR